MHINIYLFFDLHLIILIFIKYIFETDWHMLGGEEAMIHNYIEIHRKKIIKIDNYSLCEI